MLLVLFVCLQLFNFLTYTFKPKVKSIFIIYYRLNCQNLYQSSSVVILNYNIPLLFHARQTSEVCNSVAAKYGKVQVQLFQLTVDHPGPIRAACDSRTITPCLTRVVRFLSHGEQIKWEHFCHGSRLSPECVDVCVREGDTPTIEFKQTTTNVHYFLMGKGGLKAGRVCAVDLTDV